MSGRCCFANSRRIQGSVANIFKSNETPHCNQSLCKIDIRNPDVEIRNRGKPYKTYRKSAFLDLIRFNVIGRLETIVEDTTYISQKANLNFDISQFPWANKKGATKDSSLDYFKQIDAKSILKLYEIYKIDFEMFGYSVSEYL